MNVSCIIHVGPKCSHMYLSKREVESYSPHGGEGDVKTKAS